MIAKIVVEHAAESVALPVQELHTRFLYLFSYGGDAPKAVETLLAATVLGTAKAWRAGEPRGLYKDELHRHVYDFLFPKKANDIACTYLTVPHEIATGWFQDARARVTKNTEVTMKLEGPAAIELFLTTFGVGVLSITLSTQGDLHWDVVKQFNYRLAQLREETAATLRIPHPSDDPNIWAKVPEAKRKPAPADDAPLVDRVGRRGGSFTLPELIPALVEPIGAVATQAELSVYTVARFSHAVDLDDEGTVERLSPLVSALSQVEESGHAGPPRGVIAVPNAILNRCHWSAVSILGAAHLVSDQKPPAEKEEHPFNAQRLTRIRDKYFVSYLLALLQRLVFDRSIARTGEIVMARGENAAKALASARNDLLEFASNGHFTQITTRAPLHRFYRVAQDGLDVDRVFAEARSDISDLDARYVSEKQTQLSQGMASNVQAQANMQASIEWIEVFLVTVYAAHFYEMIFPQGISALFAPHVEQAEQAAKVAHEGPNVGAVVAALLAAAIASWWLKPWQHRRHH